MTHIRRIMNLPHTRNVAINTIGNYLSFAFAGFYIVFLVRVFNPEEFGILSVLLTLSYVLANVLNFGMPATIYAHLPEKLHDRKEMMSFIFSNFLFLTALSAILLFSIFIVVGWLDEVFFKTGASTVEFAIALIATQMFIWHNFIRDVLNAAGKFLYINIVANISNLVKAVILVFLAVTGSITIANTLLILGIVGPLVVFVIVLFNRRWVLKSIPKTLVSRKEIKLGYTFVYFLAMQFFQIATRADLFLVSYFLTRPEVGFYGLSQRIILAVVTSADSITQVMSPQFSKVKKQTEVWGLLKSSFLYMLLPTAMFVAGILMPNSVYEFVFGLEYSVSIGATKALSFAYLPFAFLAALSLFFVYTIKKPRYLLIANTLFLVVTVGLNIILIPQLRLYGPAVAFLVGFIVMGVYFIFAFHKEIRRLPQ